MTQPDFYQTLGVPRDATTADIRAAFIRLAKQHHPDFAGNLPWRLQNVRQAYRCLSNAAARAAHDNALGANERTHVAHQRRVAHRLRLYDRQYPHAEPCSYRRRRWRSLLIVLSGAAIVAHLSFHLIG